MQSKQFHTRLGSSVGFRVSDAKPGWEQTSRAAGTGGPGLTIPKRDASRFRVLKATCTIQRDHLESLNPDIVYLRCRRPKFLSVNDLYQGNGVSAETAQESEFTRQKTWKEGS